jgi:hypothetical protein
LLSLVRRTVVVERLKIHPALSCLKKFREQEFISNSAIDDLKYNTLHICTTVWQVATYIVEIT